ncbi:MAG: Mur ligase family protein [bacterium]|nr:Mur ligase family protein [bacterium]
MKTILQKILAILASATIRKYKPIVIGITGSVGKTSTKEAIFTVLKTKYRVRQSEKNYNNEIGVPLTILGMPNYGKNIFGWKWGIFVSCLRLIVPNRSYPEVLVLEMGTDRPGDIKYLASIAPPSVAVITAIGEIPAHVEFFAGPLEVAQEKSELFKALPSDGYALYNADDESLLEVKDVTRARKLSFGFDEHADIRISNYELRIIEKSGEDYPDGISFKISNDGNVVPMRIHGAFGTPNAYAASAATAVGKLLNMNLVEISQALESYKSPPGRTRLLHGIKGSLIIDDTYNASPESMNSALDLLEKMPAMRRIAVLGDMLEIGKYTEEAHRSVGDRVAQLANILFTVGARAKYIADEANTRGVEGKARRLETEDIFVFDVPMEAGQALDPMLKHGDVVLVKGSEGMRMEKVVEEIMAEPEKAQELLVRQNEEWKRRLFSKA